MQPDLAATVEPVAACFCFLSDHEMEPPEVEQGIQVIEQGIQVIAMILDPMKQPLLRDPAAVIPEEVWVCSDQPLCCAVEHKALNLGKVLQPDWLILTLNRFAGPLFEVQASPRQRSSRRRDLAP